jgi:myo-inositol-1(or 4)-monophosphatase
VAAGRFDGFWERGLSSWDVAAGILLVEEAGGKVTDYSGRKTDMFGPEFVASNRKLHKDLINAIQG